MNYFLKYNKYFKKMPKDCNICYLPLDSNINLKCSSSSCSSEICIDCLEGYINHYLSENKGIPKCPSVVCKDGEILYSEVKKFKNVDLLQKYSKLCLNHLKNSNIDDIMTETNHKIILEKLRRDRNDFIKKQYPIEISYVIEKALKTKLNKIDKKNKDHIKTVIKNTNKKCPNIMCYSGILDVDFTCLSCTQKFCKKCEAKLKDEHVCKEEDLESIKLVEQFVKCPKCKLPVVRSYGCNNITCSICKTNFDYVSGKLASAGNHSSDTLVLKKYDKPSMIISKDCEDSDLINYLRRIENKEPENYSFNNVLLLLKKYINEPPESLVEINKNENTIAERYELYKNSQKKKQEYHKYILLIQEEYQNKTLTKEFVMTIYNMLYFEKF